MYFPKNFVDRLAGVFVDGIFRKFFYRLVECFGDGFLGKFFQ